MHKNSETPQTPKPNEMSDEHNVSKEERITFTVSVPKRFYFIKNDDVVVVHPKDDRQHSPLVLANDDDVETSSYYDTYLLQAKKGETFLDVFDEKCLRFLNITTSVQMTVVCDECLTDVGNVVGKKRKQQDADEPLYRIVFMDVYQMPVIIDPKCDVFSFFSTHFGKKEKDRYNIIVKPTEPIWYVALKISPEYVKSVAEAIKINIVNVSNEGDVSFKRQRVGENTQ